MQARRGLPFILAMLAAGWPLSLTLRKRRSPTFATPRARASTWLAGISWLINKPTVHGIEIVGHGRNDGRNDLPIALGGGLDLVHDLTSRVSIAAGARYALTRRDESLRYLGIGPHILRAGAGLRVRLN